MPFWSNFPCILSALTTYEKDYNKCLPMRNIKFIDAEYHGKSRTEHILSSNSNSLLTLLRLYFFEAFHMEGRGKLGRLPFSRISIIVARDMKHKRKVSWHIIV